MSACSCPRTPGPATSWPSRASSPSTTACSGSRASTSAAARRRSRSTTGSCATSSPRARPSRPSSSATNCRWSRHPRPTSTSASATRAGPRSSSTRRWRGADMAGELNGRRVAILAADGVERVELEQPRRALDDAGARTDVVSIKSGEILARNNDLEDAGTFGVDRLVGAASVDEYDALLLPGGTVNPDKLRMEPAAVQFVRNFVQSGKPVASICHGPWNFVEADVARGRRLTSFPSIRTDLRNAGAEVVDEQVVTDGNITTSRSPDDLPAFCERIVEEFAQAPQSAGVGGQA